MRRQWETGRTVFFAVALLTVTLAGLIARAQDAPQIAPAMAIDENLAPCRDLCVAATGPGRVAVAWTVSEGPSQGVYVRVRESLLWSPVVRVELTTDSLQPADLALAYDTRNRLHLAWTAGPQGKRRLYLGRLDGAEGPVVLDPSPIGTEEVDFPELRAASDGSVVLAWQETEPMRFSIRAARLTDSGRTDLGRVSGDSLSGMAPQILNASRPQIAWYEIFEIGGQLCVDGWSAAERRWRPDGLERQTKGFPTDGQLQLFPTAMGLAGCWVSPAANGANTVHVGLHPDGSDAALAEETLTDPPGDGSNPNLSGNLPERLTVAWQLFDGTGQKICLAPVFTSLQSPKASVISTPGQRFAARPDHITLGDWSVVVWTDEARDGGDGQVYFTEVRWPKLTAAASASAP